MQRAMLAGPAPGLWIDRQREPTCGELISLSSTDFFEVNYTNKPTFFLNFFQKNQTANFIMCKPRVKRDTSNQHKTETMSLGLVNMSKKIDGIDAADKVIYVICVISVIMVLKWLKKC